MIGAVATANGKISDAPRRYKFGDKPHQTLPEEWIEGFLRCVYERNKNLFGDAVLRAMDAERTDKRYKGRSNG
jgi:hypothetical protein